jgi:hypothetical protein
VDLHVGQRSSSDSFSSPSMNPAAAASAGATPQKSSGMQEKKKIYRCVHTCPCRYVQLDHIFNDRSNWWKHIQLAKHSGCCSECAYPRFVSSLGNNTVTLIRLGHSRSYPLLSDFCDCSWPLMHLISRWRQEHDAVARPCGRRSKRKLECDATASDPAALLLAELSRATRPALSDHK